MRRTRTLLAVIVTMLATGASRAAVATCPDVAPESAKDRRALAKDWFSKAESAETAEDDLGAVKAYSCSMKMVPHAFTAFNLARVAEKSGDLELALESYRAYLTLKPDAPDGKEIQERIANLETRINAVREPRPTPEPTASETPPPVAAPAIAPPERPTMRPAPRALTEAPAPDEESPRRMGVTEWTIAGVGVAALAGGVVLNVMARDKSQRCHAAVPHPQLCREAKPLAYASYALFGAAAVAAVADAVLIVRKGSDTGVSVAPTTGGLSMSLRLRF